MWLRAHPIIRMVLDIEERPSFCRQVFGNQSSRPRGQTGVSLTGGAGGEENSEIPETFMFEWMSRVGGRQRCHDKATAER